MGLFKKLFSKKDVIISKELEVIASTKKGCIGKAEKIANIITAGLEKEDYSGMNKQLSVIDEGGEERDTYVFEPPGVVSRYYGIAFIVSLSLSYIYYLFIGVGAIYLTPDAETNSLGMLLVGLSIAVLLLNIVIVSKIICTIRFKSRYDIYEELLSYKSLEFVEGLSIYAKQKETLVVKDLQKAIKEKLIPQGHLSCENRVFMVSNEVYERYMEKAALYDRYFQKMIEETHQVKSRTKRISQILEKVGQYIEKIQEYSNLVKDKNISGKIGRMKSIVSMISYEIDVNPRQVQFLREFLNYYLPTTEKLLDAYVIMDEKQVVSNKSVQTRKEFKQAISTVVIAFEAILKKLYEEYEMDIASEIETMELSMKQKGLTV